MSGITAKLAQNIADHTVNLERENAAMRQRDANKSAFDKTAYGRLCKSVEDAAEPIEHVPVIGTAASFCCFLVGDLLGLPAALFKGFAGTDFGRDVAMAHAIATWNAGVDASGIGYKYGITHREVFERQRNVTTVRELIAKEKPEALGNEMKRLLNAIDEASGKSILATRVVFQ